MVGRTLAGKLIEAHQVSGNGLAGEEIGLAIRQTLVHDTTGPLVVLEMMAMGLDSCAVEVAGAYVDHRVIQPDERITEEHAFLQSAARALGMWFSPPGNGISHVVHLESFAAPGTSLLGADSHTCGVGGLGALAIGAGGLDVALAHAGRPYFLRRPKIWRIELEGGLPEWTSAKDVVLELLSRIGVGGAAGYALEYAGSGVSSLSVMDRFVIANMGAELGASFSVFPSDERTSEFLGQVHRGDQWIGLAADSDAVYDRETTLDLGLVEPMIAMPGSPGNVVRVQDVAGRKIGQSYIGSSANPGYRDIAIVARMIDGRSISDHVSLDINPASRRVLRQLITEGDLGRLVASGARFHDTGCNGCIGMGQVPVSGVLSLRTVPRNFPGRSGAVDDQVCLVSPETAAASALTGVITDPRDSSVPYPGDLESALSSVDDSRSFVVSPDPVGGDGHKRTGMPPLGKSIKPIPKLPSWSEHLTVPVILMLKDNISTDAIVSGGKDLLPLRSDVLATSEFVFRDIDPTYVTRAHEHSPSGHVIVAGSNFGQGSSRELSALAPRHLGLRVVLAKGFARIYQDNLTNFGIIPLLFVDSESYMEIGLMDVLVLDRISDLIVEGAGIVRNRTRGQDIRVRHELSDRQVTLLKNGGAIGSMAIS